MKPSAVPTGSPRSTWSPTATHSLAGFPACWRNGSTISSGYGMRRIGSRFVSAFSSGGWTPCRNPVAKLIARSVELRRAFGPLAQILFLRIERRARMNDCHRAPLGCKYQLLERAGGRVLHERLLVGVVGEDLLAEIGALVAGGAARRVDVGLQHQPLVGLDNRRGGRRFRRRGSGSRGYSRRC